MSQTQIITVDDFKRMFMLEDHELPPGFQDRLSVISTTYRAPTQDELEEYILNILRIIHSDKKARDSEENIAAFEKGWQENLDLAHSKGISLETLRPLYFRPGKYFRYDRKLIIPDNPNLEYDLFVIARLLIFFKYLEPYHTIYEFGCGSCANLLMLSEMFPEKQFVGLDWTSSSIEIAKLLDAKSEAHISAEKFDFYNPPQDFKFEPGSAIVTIHSLEQIGKRHDAWLDFLARQRPGIIINYEPILEFYDETNLLDYLATLYSAKRGYLKGYYPAISELAEKGDVKIHAAFRPFLGGILHEASLLVWSFT